MPAFPEHVRRFVATASWRFARTYASTWPHEYVVRNDGNAAMILALAKHILEHGTDGRFYSQVRKYHHEGGKVYWSMANTPEEATLINRCDEDQTYEARLAAGTLPSKNRQVYLADALGLHPHHDESQGIAAVRGEMQGEFAAIRGNGEGL